LFDDNGYESAAVDVADVGAVVRILNPRRGFSPSVPFLDTERQMEGFDKIVDAFHLDDYRDCVTAEMPHRPIPEAFDSSHIARLTDLYVKWLPLIYRWMIPQMEAPYQAYQKTSRMGWPIFGRPPNKVDAIFNLWPPVAAGDISFFDQAFTICNVRLQPEPLSKVRDFTYAKPDGGTFRKKTGKEDRLITVAGRTRYASRTRLVFNLPTTNLMKQPLDTAIHNVFLKHPAYHHDMFNQRLLPVKGHHMAFDVKHFERHTSACARARASFIGGTYGRIYGQTVSLPFVVPSVDGPASPVYLWVRYEDGFAVQYASGDSAVAPVQKEVLTALYAEFAVRFLGVEVSKAIDWVAQGGDHRLTIRNYGDDNSVDGDEKVCDDLFEFLKNYLTVEREVPPKFLGFEWSPMDGWRLPDSSYLLRTWLNERRPFSNFRRFPCLGWVEKRLLYSRLGYPGIVERVFDVEDKILAESGLQWSKIFDKAIIERRRASESHLQGVLTPEYLLGKSEYLLTHKERMETGEYMGILPPFTRKIIRALVGAEFLKQMRL
jgi:hypothetical protein